MTRQGFTITEAEEALVHVHARALAAASLQHHGDFSPDDIAGDAVNLLVATRTAIRSHNERAAEVEAKLAGHGFGVAR